QQPRGAPEQRNIADGVGHRQPPGAPLGHGEDPVPAHDDRDAQGTQEVDVAISPGGSGVDQLIDERRGLEGGCGWHDTSICHGLRSAYRGRPPKGLGEPPERYSMPCSTAKRMSSCRRLSWSLPRMLRTWFSTVFSAMNSRPPISLYECPRATSWRTSRSRSDSGDTPDEALAIFRNSPRTRAAR